MLCKRCAAVIEDGEKICIHCGADQEEFKKKAKQIQPEKHDLTFIDCLITFFVGGIPIIGCIMLMIWSFGSEKIKGRSTVAKAFLLWSVFVTLLVIVASIYFFYYILKNADMY